MAVTRSTVARVALRVLAGLGLAVLVAAGAGWWWFDSTIVSSLPQDLTRLQDWRPPTVCQILDRHGDEVHRFYVERRIWVPLDELDPVTAAAFVAAEDRRFYDHPGVDPLGILRAAAANWQAGSVTQGGSTITQQLVKNLLVGTERSYERKLKEAVLAYRLEQELSKDEVLELFLNYIYLGAGNYGVEAAARDYFGISARDLDPGQAALLAGLIPAPSVYNPRRSPDTAARRRALVLTSMVEEGILTAEEAFEYDDDDVLVPRVAADEDDVGVAYVTAVRREVRQLLPGTEVFDHGVEVRTPLDLEVQRVAEEAVARAVAAVQERQGHRGPVRTLERTRWASFLDRGPGLDRDDAGQLVAPEPGRCFQALVPEKADLGALRAGGLTFALARAERDAPTHTGEGPQPLQQLVGAGDVLEVCLEEDGTVTLDDAAWAEGAAVVIEHETGRVVALTGGVRSGLEGFVRALQAKRQPGSSFKPYVYAAALLDGRTQLDRIVDAPLSLPAGGGRTWSPQNYSGGFAGPQSLRTALARSSNTIAVRLILETGVERTAALARAMGVQTPLRTDPTLALGSSEVTPMDQALGYTTIARGGVPIEPVLIDALVDASGRELGRAGGPLVVDGRTLATMSGREGPRVLPEGVAYELSDMLRHVVRAGTGRKAWRKDLERAGKTGTTNDYVDAWFVGFTPNHTVAVWVGTDGTASLGEGETGGRAALPAWIEIVEALDEPPGVTLRVPDDAVLVPVGGEWIGLARGRVPAAALPIRPSVPDEPLPPFVGRGPRSGY